VLILLSAAARADSLADARAAMTRLDYPAANAALTSALASGTYGPGDLAEIYELSGIVAASLGDTNGALDAFKRMLSLQPTARLRPGTSPKIARPFAEAATFAKEHQPLEVTTTQSTTAPASVTVVVKNDPVAMVRGARIIVAADGKPEETLKADGTISIAVELPVGKRLELRIEVLDEHGNRLVELGSTARPIVIEPVEPPPVVKPPVVTPPVVQPPPPPPPPPPLYARWWLWGGVAAALGVTGMAFGIATHAEVDELSRLQADSRNHTFDEAQAVLDRARTYALVTNLSLGAAAGAAIASGVLFYLHTRRAEKPIAVAPAAMRTGAGVTLEVSF
jgi:hypothetical protein